jgi:replicative DNA helicase
MPKTQLQNIAKIAPNSKDSEIMVLGCMLTSVNSLNVCADSLDEQDFYYTEHQTIFRVLKEVYKRNSPADIHIIGEELKRQKKLQEIGGVSYLTTLAQYSATSAYVEEYTKLVKEKAILRKIIISAQEIEKEALNDPENVLITLDDAQAKFFKISQRFNSEEGYLLKEIISGIKSKDQVSYLKKLQQRQENFQKRGPEEAGITGLNTHFVDLDKMINGLNNSNLMILAARPAMGKTALALNLAENLCFKNNMPVGIFSLEMSASQVLHRMICSQTEIESVKIQTGSLDGDEYQRVVGCVNNMLDKTMIIDDQPSISITDLRARARRMKEAFDIKALFIDYLQLISGSGSTRAYENRQNEISEISRMLKGIARELDIPVVCLSQLSRKVEERQGHRPLMSDLRESGSIEQDSDIVMFLLRREYYDKHDKPGQAELIVGKNRHGAVGSINLTFRSEIAQFANYIPISTDEDVFE